jgi:hypothetical protein
VDYNRERRRDAGRTEVRAVLEEIKAPEEGGTSLYSGNKPIKLRVGRGKRE